MTKLCPRGKAAAKRKFKVYPSAYANAYASRICAGKIKDPSGVKRKDFRGPKKAMGGRIMKAGGGDFLSPGIIGKERRQEFRPRKQGKSKAALPKPRDDRRPELKPRKKAAGGGLMEATARLKKQGLKGGGMSSRGLGRAFMKGGRV
jgi:hypothetical protein